VEKKTLLTAAFILALFLMAMTEGCFVKFAQANPYMYYEHVSPPADATPLVISVSSPKNKAVYRVNDIALTFNVNAQGTSLDSIYGVSFKASWIEDNVTVYPDFCKFWSYDETFGGMPDGEYGVVIIAWGGGHYGRGLTYYYFHMTTISVVNFTIATPIPPEVSILSPLNKTYDSSDVPLNFTVSEAVSQISYVLDGQENMTVNGNITLTELPNGDHNVTVSATDEFGNTGVSEMIYFSVEVPEPFPTTILVVASALSIAVISIGSVAYFRKVRKRRAE
jgi:hypothetical protein